MIVWFLRGICVWGRTISFIRYLFNSGVLLWQVWSKGEWMTEDVVHQNGTQLAPSLSPRLGPFLGLFGGTLTGSWFEQWLLEFFSAFWRVGSASRGQKHGENEFFALLSRSRVSRACGCARPNLMRRKNLHLCQKHRKAQRKCLG
jgi:hypothetical protein